MNGFKCAHGCGSTWATGVAVDANGYFYLVGETQAGSLPTTVGVVQPTGAPLDVYGAYVLGSRGFIAKFAPVTSAGGVTLAYATYLGGQTNASDYISGIAIDGSSNAYVVGYTNSKDFPVTSGAYGTVCGTGGVTCAAAHVTKLNPTGTAILWSTYVGDSKSDRTDALYFTGPIQLDGKGNIYIMGQVGTSFPMVNPVEPDPNPRLYGAMEVLVAELDPTGANVLFSTRIGSGGRETANPAGLAVDSAGDIYLAGNIIGQGLITTPGAFQTTVSDSSCCYHGFVAKIAPSAHTPQISSLGNGASQQAGIVSNSFFTILGTNLSSQTDTWDNAIVNGALPQSLDGVSVSVGGQPAYILYVSAGQIYALAPNVGPGNVSVTVTNSNGTSAPVTAVVQMLQPAFFQWGSYAVATRTDFSPAVKNGTLSGLTTVPAKPGDTILLWGTGFGPTTPSAPAGVLIPSGATYSTANTVTVTVGGVAATVNGAALMPGSAGLYQVAIQIPVTLSDGDYPVIATVSGAQSPATTLVTVQK